jgi:hypothetical protein
MPNRSGRITRLVRRCCQKSPFPEAFALVGWCCTQQRIGALASEIGRVLYARAMPRLGAAAIRCALAGVLLSGRSGANEAARVVTFSGPEAECPPAAYVDERVRRLLGSVEPGASVSHVVMRSARPEWKVDLASESRRFAWLGRVRAPTERTIG